MHGQAVISLQRQHQYFNYYGYTDNFIKGFIIFIIKIIALQDTENMGGSFIKIVLQKDIY